MKIPVSLKDDFKREFAKSRYAAVFPFYGGILAGTDSTLWVASTHVADSEGRRYVVYDRSGHAIARAELPERVRPLRVSRNRVLGVLADQDDVPHVLLWRIGPGLAR